jgi:2-phosphosulfolactate phosphatase
VTPAVLTDDDADQHGFAFRFDWGAEGLHALAPACDVIVIVDVLRFTSAVSAALERGSIVFPYRWRDDAAATYAAERDAVLAGARSEGPISLSPTDLLTVATPTRIVLPSPNGSTVSYLAREAGVPFVLAGSLRNAAATARRALALAHSGAIGVVAAGERWPREGGPLRPCVEDLLGAGAVLAALDPSAAVSAPCGSPEAMAARAAFIAARPLLEDALADSASGRELARVGYGDDVATASQLDVSDLAAQLVDDAFVAV